jgi:hypothetical protein
MYLNWDLGYENIPSGNLGVNQGLITNQKSQIWVNFGGLEMVNVGIF